MPIDDILLDGEERMARAVQVFRDDLRGIRTGTASAGLVESIRVDYYGSPTPLMQLAGIAVPAPNLIVIKPYDPKVLDDIQKAIQKSDIGIHPQNDGKVIRLTIPSLTEERRTQLASRIKEMAEQARISIRNVRRDANRHLDREEKQSDISEDECHTAKEDVQELTGQYEDEVDELLKKKVTEVTSI